MTQIWTSCGGRQDPNQIGYQIACAHDYLGWKNFTHGRISYKYVEIQENHILAQSSRGRRLKSSPRWASGLVDMIIRITHRQWLFRNEFLHYQHHYGAESQREYSQIMARINHLHQHTDPDDLLPEDRYLLEQDVGTVAQWNARKRQICLWAAEFETSLAARRARRTKLKRRRERLGAATRSRQGRRKTKRRAERDSRQRNLLQSSRHRFSAASSIGTNEEGSQRHKRRKKRNERT